MSSPVRDTMRPRRSFSPRVFRCLQARLQKLAIELSDGNDCDGDFNVEARDGNLSVEARNGNLGVETHDGDLGVEAHDGHNVNSGGHGRQDEDDNGNDHKSDHGKDHSDSGNNDSLLVHTSDDESTSCQTSLNDSLLGSAASPSPNEDPNGMPSAAALRDLSLVEGDDPGYFFDDAYIRPAASDLEIDEEYWVKHNSREAGELPSELPGSHRTFHILPPDPAREHQHRLSANMEESGFLVHAERVCSRDAPGHYHFIPISQLRDTERSHQVEIDGKVMDDVKDPDDVKVTGDVKSMDNIKATDDSRPENHAEASDAKLKHNIMPESGTNRTTGPDGSGKDDCIDKDDDSDSEWEFVSTWPEAEEAEALLELSTIRFFPRALLP